MFFLTRVKGVYTFDDADSKRKMVIDVPKKQALINFEDWHLRVSGGVISLSRENGDICANVNHSLLHELLSIVFDSTYSDFAKWAEIEQIDRAISLSERYPDLHFGGYINIDSGMFNGKFIQFCLNEGIDFHMRSWRTFLKLERIKQQMPQDLQKVCLIFGDDESFAFEKKDLIKLARLLKNNSEKQINKGQLYRITDLLDEIEDMTTENYCVVVPRSLEDLIVEGQQQNNCVGYYYCDDIAANFSLIYFIRRKNDKSKSVYTCRYSTSMNETVEFRGFNNSNITEEEVLSFLKKIDYRLRSILKG